MAWNAFLNRVSRVRFTPGPPTPIELLPAELSIARVRVQLRFEHAAAQAISDHYLLTID